MILLLIGKFNLGGLYEKIGFNKEIISRGRFAELTAAEQRPFRCETSFPCFAYEPICVFIREKTTH